MHLAMDFPLGSTVRTRHPSQQTIQEGTVVGYWENYLGVYVRFKGAPEVYSFDQQYARDRTCLTLIRQGSGRV